MQRMPAAACTGAAVWRMRSRMWRLAVFVRTHAAVAGPWSCQQRCAAQPRSRPMQTWMCRCCCDCYCCCETRALRPRHGICSQARPPRYRDGAVRLVGPGHRHRQQVPSRGSLYRPQTPERAVRRTCGASAQSSVQVAVWRASFALMMLARRCLRATRQRLRRNVTGDANCCAVVLTLL